VKAHEVALAVTDSVEKRVGISVLASPQIDHRNARSECCHARKVSDVER
jgi:hypothetical protein